MKNDLKENLEFVPIIVVLYSFLIIILILEIFF